MPRCGLGGSAAAGERGDQAKQKGDGDGALPKHADLLRTVEEEHESTQINTNPHESNSKRRTTFPFQGQVPRPRLTRMPSREASLANSACIPQDRCDRAGGVAEEVGGPEAVEPPALGFEDAGAEDVPLDGVFAAVKRAASQRTPRVTSPGRLGWCRARSTQKPSLPQ